MEYKFSGNSRFEISAKMLTAGTQDRQEDEMRATVTVHYVTVLLVNMNTYVLLYECKTNLYKRF